MVGLTLTSECGEPALKTVEVGELGIRYALSYLEHAGDYISQLVLRRGLDTGTAEVIVPNSADLDRVFDLHSGGINTDPSLAFDDYLSSVLATFLGSAPGNVVLFEYPSGPNAIQPSSNCFHYRPSLSGTWDGEQWSRWETGAVVYLTPAECFPDQLRRFVADAAWGSRIGFLTELSDVELTSIHSGEQVCDSVLQQVAENLRHLIVPVYSRESYLIWSVTANWQARI